MQYNLIHAFIMSSNLIKEKAHKFSIKVVELWNQADRPVLHYPNAPKDFGSWCGDKAFKEVIETSSLSTKQKLLLTEILDLCIAEKEELQKTYAQSTFVKDITNEYRKAIAKTACVENQNKVTPVCFFTPDKLSIIQVNEVSVNKQRLDRVPITLELKDKLIETAVKIIESETKTGLDVYSKAVSLELLTGRRCFVEILFQANFKVYSDTEIIFTGQAKADDEKRVKEFIIPVLGISPLQALETLNEIRDYITSRPWFDESTTAKDVRRKVDSQTDKAIMKHYFKLFMPLWSSGHKFSLSTHSFRKLYVTFCHYSLAPEKSFLHYASSILGHDYESVTGNVRTGTSSQHYDAFYVVGE